MDWGCRRSESQHEAAEPSKKIARKVTPVAAALLDFKLAKNLRMWSQLPGNVLVSVVRGLEEMDLSDLTNKRLPQSCQALLELVAWQIWRILEHTSIHVVLLTIQHLDEWLASAWICVQPRSSS